MIKRLAHLAVIPFTALILGMMLLTEFYTHLALGHFTPEGFAQGMASLIELGHAPPFLKQGFAWTAHHATLFAPLAAVVMALTTLSLLLSIGRNVSLWVTTLIFLFYWVGLWAYPGIWGFEFLFPLTFAFCAACASFSENVLGSRQFGKLSWPCRLVIVLLAAAALWYVIVLGKNGGAHTWAIAWQASLTFALLFGLSAWFDARRTHSAQETQWINVMVLVVGGMMCIQVFADQAVGFYTVEGYAKLVHSYAHDSSAPEWYRAFLNWSANQALLLMPLQAAFEIGVAILLSLLIVRGPAIFFTGLMFAVFTYAEFGVKAELPSSPIHTFTNTWELLFVTLVSLFIGLKQSAQLFQTPTWRGKILGDPLYGNLKLFWRIGIAILAGGALLGVGIKTHFFSEHYVRTSWFGALLFSVLLCVRALLEPHSSLNRSSRRQRHR